LSEGFSHNSRGLPGSEGQNRNLGVEDPARRILHDSPSVQERGTLEVSMSCSLLVNSSLPMSRRVSGNLPYPDKFSKVLHPFSSAKLVCVLLDGYISWQSQ
jgi:hypothetical protein